MLPTPTQVKGKIVGNPHPPSSQSRLVRNVILIPLIEVSLRYFGPEAA